MDVYNYDPETGEYLSTTTARKHPLRAGEFIIPASATTEAPPEPVDGFTRNFINGEWVQVEIPAPPEPVTDVNGNIYNAPDTLFGGPQLKEVFNVYR